ncbi:E3 ubiquitin/ISG15 ligase TRIM25-like [Centroberyx affinis]|uniref:E3 ubiquitin/ISG15 ligase TRIM25-like n=1 Tax=Centroberyx affinis TaxID=166261 RepID=UPI003A5B97E1
MSSSKPARLLAYELSCPICLQLFSDPVALPCGHNYCLSCIRKASDTIDGNGKVLPRCPECREEYEGADSLQKNFKLCSIIEGYRATALTQDGPPEPVQELEVFCDHCIDGGTPAVKTCLRCEVSLCARHLQRHQEKESFRSHSLVEPQNELGTRACVTHGRPLEYFCSSDMTSLCATCFIEGAHQNHDVLTFDVAEEEMRRALESRSKVVSCRLQMTEGLLQRAAEERGASEAIGDKLVNKAVTLMDNMAALVDRYRERLTVLLEEERGQRRQSWQLGLAALEDQQQQLLEAQQSATQALSETDKCLFIHRFMLIESQLREAVTGSVSSKIPSQTPLNTKRLQAGLKTQDFRSEMTRLLESLHVVLNPLQLTFNLSTAHPSLTLSNDLRTVKYSPTKLPYGENLERFTSAPQVLCTQGFSSGDHMWVVEVGVHSMWSLGLCYKSIPRRGDHSRLGHNTVSWRLQWKNKKLTACHASSNVALGETAIQPLRIEVALDYEGGTLEFHSTKGRREHLHTFRTVFREPVYPAFSIHSNTPESWITLQSGM